MPIQPSTRERTRPRLGRRALAVALAILGLGLLALWYASDRRPHRSPQRPEVSGDAVGRQPPASSPSTGSAPSRPLDGRPRFPVVDVHVHLAPGGLTRLDALSKRHGIEIAVNLSGGHPLDELPRQIESAEASGPRGVKVVVFASLAYEQIRYPEAGERMAALLRLSREQGARGLKIAKLLGLGLRWPSGELVRVDDPRLDPVFEAAGELNMPVAIHTGDPEAFWLPVDDDNPRQDELRAHPGWSLYGRDVPSYDELSSQLENRIARHQDTTFISVHFGNAAEHPERVAAMLRRYPNLYIDTAARIPEMGRHDPELMRRFFVEFQDRVLYGSDLGVGPAPSPLFLGSSGDEPPTRSDRERFFAASYRYFETRDRNFAHPTPIQGNWTVSGLGLPSEVLAKIYRDNAKRLLGLP